VRKTPAIFQRDILMITPRQEVYRRGLDALELSVRAHRVVEELGCVTIADVAALSHDELMAHPSCGRKTVDEINFMLDLMDDFAVRLAILREEHDAIS
jgi:DNA-directed RNA polymerase alpha subunit